MTPLLNISDLYSINNLKNSAHTPNYAKTSIVRTFSVNRNPSTNSYELNAAVPND